jgi:uncharacterized membrane protein YesL
MFQSFFSGDNPIFRFTGLVLDIVVLSLLWLLCSLPLLTLVPATAALYYSCVKCLRYKEPGPYGSFLRAFRENLRTGVPVSAVVLAASALLWMGYRGLSAALPAGDRSSAVVLLACLLLLLLPVGVFSMGAALLSRFDCTVSSLLANSLRMTLGHLPRVLAAAFCNAATALLCIRYFYFLVWLALPAIDALLVSRFLEPVLRRYTPGREDGEDSDSKPWYLK